MVGDWLNSDWLAVVGYLGAAMLSIWWGMAERSRKGSHPLLFPAFWFSTAAIVALMAVGRGTDIGGLLAAAGRREAHAEGWYASRRVVQAVLVASIAGVWAITVGLAIWRVPARRRRYLPTGVAVATLICYTAIRSVSLHQVDALLYRRKLRGVRYVAVFEVLLLVVTVAAIWVGGRRPLPRMSAPHRSGSARRPLHSQRSLTTHLIPERRRQR